MKYCFWPIIFMVLLLFNGCSKPSPTAYKNAPPSPTVGYYVMPSLPGWDGEAHNGSHISSFTYTKILQSNKILLTLVSFNAPTGVAPPSSVADLAKIVNEGLKASNAYGTDKFVVLTSKPSAFNNHPAYFLEKKSVSTASTTVVKTLDFVDDNRLYRFRMTLEGKTLPPVEIKFAEDSWNVMLLQTKHK